MTTDTTTNKPPKSPISLAAGRVRKFLRYARLRVGLYKGNRADIVAADNFGKALAALARCDSFVNYVEIGTAHGLGTTKIIADGLFSRPDSCCLWTIEASRLNYDVAIRNWRNTDLRGRVVFIHGTIAADNMMTWQEVQAHPAGKNYTYQTYHKYKEVANEATDAMPHLPPQIDVLLLDGGELHSYGEYRALAPRAKVICLDDTFTVIKNRRVREELLTDDKWQVMVDKPQERNGWAIFCRREYLKDMPDINK